MAEPTTPRQQAVEWVAAVLDEVLATAGLVVSDVSGGLKEPMDAAERGMTLCLIPEEEDQRRQWAFNALAEYQVLLRAKAKVAARFDLTTSRGGYRLSQSLPGINELIADARERAITFAGQAAVDGVVAGGASGSSGVTEIEMDWSSSDGWDSEYAR